MDQRPRDSVSCGRFRNRHGRGETEKNFSKMNRKQLILLLVLVVVLGGAGLIIRQQQDKSWQPKNPGVGKKLLGNLPVNDVARLALKQGTNELNLVKKDNLW